MWGRDPCQDTRERVQSQWLQYCEVRCVVVCEGGHEPWAGRDDDPVFVQTR